MKFEDAIEFIRRTSIGVPKSFVIDLSIVEVDREYSIAGNLLYLLSAPDGDSYIDVKFNGVRESAIRLYAQMGLVTPFAKFYVTTPAGQTGNMTILYAVEAPDFLEVIDNRSATSADLSSVRNELQGDIAHEGYNQTTIGAAPVVEVIAANADRKGCTLQALSTNTGIVYLGFDNAVTTAVCFFELQPGMSFTFNDYRGDIFAVASAAGQLVAWGEW